MTLAIQGNTEDLSCNLSLVKGKQAITSYRFQAVKGAVLNAVLALTESLQPGELQERVDTLARLTKGRAVWDVAAIIDAGRWIDELNTLAQKEEGPLAIF